MKIHDEKKAEQIKRLSGVVQDISAKLLVVPLAYVLIAGQLATDGGMKNHIIIIGAAVFALLMTLMVINQFVSLVHIRQDIDQMKTDYADRLQKTAWSGPFSQLTMKYWVQFWLLLMVIAIIIGIFCLTFSLYWDYTHPPVAGPIKP